MIRNKLLAAALLSFSLIVAGCGSGGPAVGTVTGVVTLDGKPLEKATVSFHPESGRGSVGVTDSEGRYELVYSKDQKGASIGSHKVTISSQVFAEESRNIDYEGNPEGANLQSKGRAELLPAKYRLKEKTELSAEIKSGENECDFPLESK